MMQSNPNWQPAAASNTLVNLLDRDVAHKLFGFTSPGQAHRRLPAPAFSIFVQ